MKFRIIALAAAISLLGSWGFAGIVVQAPDRGAMSKCPDYGQEFNDAYPDLGFDEQAEGCPSPLSAIKIPATSLPPVRIDIARIIPVGPFDLIGHSGNFYPKTPFIIVKDVSSDKANKALRLEIGRLLETDTFDDAEIISADSFYQDWIFDQPEEEKRIKREWKETMIRFEEEERKAMLFRLGDCNDRIKDECYVSEEP